jgi:hypothetical protein
MNNKDKSHHNPWSHIDDEYIKRVEERLSELMERKNKEKKQNKIRLSMTEIDSLIDLALMTNDKEWFMELTNKRKMAC